MILFVRLGIYTVKLRSNEYEGIFENAGYVAFGFDKIKRLNGNAVYFL